MPRAEKAWPGPKRGDDKDRRFLVDYDSDEESPRTGRARLENSRDEWSPEDDRPFTLRPMLDEMQQEREEQARQRQEVDQAADDGSEDGGPPPRAELIRRPRRTRATSRAILTSNADGVDSSTTRLPTGKGIGERSRQRVSQSRTRSRRRNKSRDDSSSSEESSDKRPP